MHKPNNIVEHDVKEEFDWDPLLDNSRIVVKASDGEVTLTGAVPTYYESVLAGDDAWSIGGVTLVDNQLLVGIVGEAIVDGDIAAACVTALDDDRWVPHGAIDVVVTEGWVTLTGQVRRHFQRRAALHAVRRVDGVLGITDGIVINGDPIPSDVADRINRAFRRNAIIDESLIDVTTSGSTVYLDGTVGSWRSMDEAVDTAWQAPGVAEVVNRLVVVY